MMMKTKTFVFILLLFGFLSCKKNRLQQSCGIDKPLERYFDGGYIALGNVFTPGGTGINDNARVRSKGIKDYEIRFFNRLGREIFLSTDTAVHWDAWHKGKILYGRYRYQIKATTINGENLEIDGRICSIDFNKFNCLENADNLVTSNMWINGKFETDFPYDAIARHMRCD